MNLAQNHVMHLLHQRDDKILLMVLLGFGCEEFFVSINRKKKIKQIIDSVRVLQPYSHYFKTNLKFSIQHSQYDKCLGPTSS